MRILWLTLLCLIFVSAGAAYGQSWDSGVSTGALNIQWTFDVDTYTFNVTNPVVENREYQVVAWSLQPFNIAEPASVVCPKGWEWRGQGGWNYFDLSKSNQKYDVGGPALEPGETLTFKYTIGSSTTPANSGGPADSVPAFLAHIGAVNGVNKAEYVPYQMQLGQTWHEMVVTKPFLQTPVPEPANIFVISSGFFALGCFRFKRARV